MPELGDFPTCDQFEITILDGQPCYSLDVSKKVKDPTKLGKNHGLLLLLDPFPYQPMEGKMDGQSFKVYIHTVSQFTAHGPGTYSMTVLKKTTGTKKFLQLPDDRKKCSDHKREECQTQAYLDQIQRECKCVPWALKIPTRQVTFSIFESIPSLQGSSFCGPERESCVENQTLRDKSCLVPWTGLYADIADDSLEQTTQVLIEGNCDMLSLTFFDRRLPCT